MALKRSAPIARRTALRSSSTLARSPMKRRRRRARAGDDPAYLAFIRSLPCCAPDTLCRNVSEPHHHSLYGAGMARKAPDSATMPLCGEHHRWGGLHVLRGPFIGWDKERLRAWQDAQVARCRALWKARTV